MMTTIAVLATFAVFTVFVVAAASKVRSRAAFTDFAVSLGEFGLRGRVLLAAAVAVVALEFLLCAAFIVGLYASAVRQVALVIASVILVAFTAAVVRASRNSERFVCRCFGADDVTNVPLHVATNVSLAILCAVGAFLSGEPMVNGTALFGAGLGVLFGFGVVASEVLIDTLLLGSSIPHAQTALPTSHEEDL